MTLLKNMEARQVRIICLLQPPAEFGHSPWFHEPPIRQLHFAIKKNSSGPRPPWGPRLFCYILVSKMTIETTCLYYFLFNS